MKLDARGLTCPKPIVMAMEALPKLTQGEPLEILVDEDIAVENLQRLATEKACEVVVEEAEKHTVVTLRPKTQSISSENLAAEITAAEVTGAEVTGAEITGAEVAGAEISGTDDASTENTAPVETAALPPFASVILVDSDTFGRGEEELGHILMKGLIYALAHQEHLPQSLIFFNNGAKLTCEGSESLEDIKELEQKGVEILTCGTCLEFHGIKEELQVGGITNLYHIAEVLTSKTTVTL